jgi:hypothetical protein
LAKTSWKSERPISRSQNSSDTVGPYLNGDTLARALGFGVLKYRPPQSTRHLRSLAEDADVTRTKMSERQGTVAGVLIASMFIGFSYERNVGQAAQTRTLQQPHAGAIDHFVPHISTERANKGSRVSLFVRERRGARRGAVYRAMEAPPSRQSWTIPATRQPITSRSTSLRILCRRLVGDRASRVERCCRLDAVGASARSKPPPSIPHVIATPPSSRGP